jgi:hypothetical protein
MRFTYEFLTPEDSGIPGEVAAELAADMTGAEIDVFVEIVASDVGRELAEGERWIYLRREVLPSDE